MPTGDAFITDAALAQTRAAAAQVVVIGAGGFVGRHLVRGLAATAEFRPVAASRRPIGADVEWRRCDATDVAALSAALAGADAAVNCVAGSGPAMVAATGALCAAARAAGLQRIVHLSSMAVYGPATGLVDEDHALAGGGAYAQAKRDCEALIRAHGAAGGDAVILRPGCIHGPGSEQWTGRIARLLRRRRIGDLGAAGDGLANLVAARDVAAAVLAALRRADVTGQAFNLADPDPASWNSYFVALARAVGATPVRRVTRRWLRLEGSLLAPACRIARLVGLPAADPVPPSLLALWRQDIRLDHRRADALLGFVRTPPAAALAEAAAWVKAAWGAAASPVRSGTGDRRKSAATDTGS
jgi:nucleoside-diphosphate-sugar epimerase